MLHGNCFIRSPLVIIQASISRLVQRSYLFVSCRGWEAISEGDCTVAFMAKGVRVSCKGSEIWVLAGKLHGSGLRPHYFCGVQP